MHERAKPLNSVLVKPAGPDCNLNCGYCFYLDRADLFPKTKIHRMDDAVLEEMIKQVMHANESHVSFGWQGGEPTLMGLPFFENAVRLQMKYGKNQSVGNGLQTNGILLDKAWIPFLKRYNFLVGLSLDGPEHIHDRYRVFKSGKGSWAKVVDRAKLLLDSGVSVNALTVVNDYSVRFPDEIYAFHKQLGLNYMQFIPCVEKDLSRPDRTTPFSVSPEAYGNFLVRLFDLWTADFTGATAATFVRFFDSIFHKYVGLKAPECTLNRTCGEYVVVEHNGDVYSCDFFVQPEWRLGNLMNGSLADMLNSPLQRKFGLMKAVLPEGCVKCLWVKTCRGGCPKDRVPGSINHLCQSYMALFEHGHQRLVTLAKKWLDENAMSAAPRSDGKRSKPGRNDPCPCGSGKKYKKCCGPNLRIHEKTAYVYGKSTRRPGG